MNWLLPETDLSTPSWAGVQNFYILKARRNQGSMFLHTQTPGSHFLNVSPRIFFNVQRQYFKFQFYGTRVRCSHHSSPVTLLHLVQVSSVIIVHCSRQGLSTPLMLSSISQWTEICTLHSLYDGQNHLLSKTTAGAPGLVLYLLVSASASIFPAALRSQCTLHHLLCWEEGPPNDMTCSHLPSTWNVSRLPSAVEDPPLHG
jgi:hypothetical protein